MPPSSTLPRPPSLLFNLGKARASRACLGWARVLRARAFFCADRKARYVRFFNKKSFINWPELMKKMAHFTLDFEHKFLNFHINRIFLRFSNEVTKSANIKKLTTLKL